jgi:hypothetical protein
LRIESIQYWAMGDGAGQADASEAGLALQIGFRAACRTVGPAPSVHRCLHAQFNKFFFEIGKMNFSTIREALKPYDRCFPSFERPPNDLWW